MLATAPITVAIATLNRATSLSRCLAALASGSRLPLEIVVVDQGIDDATQIAVRTFYVAHLRLLVGLASKSGRSVEGWSLLYLRQDRKGLAASRNAAILAAKQPFIAFTDDDCIPDQEWVNAIWRQLEQPGCPDAVTGRVLPFGPEVPGLYAVSSRTSTVRKEFRSRSLPWRVGTGANVAVALSWVRRIGGFDERLGAGTRGAAGEDLDFLYRLLIHRCRVLYDPSVIMYHERQSLSRRLASRLTYGNGAGAFCGIHLRRADGYALVIAARWILLRMKLLVHALLASSWKGVREELLILRGTLAGLIYGLRVQG